MAFRYMCAAAVAFAIALLCALPLHSIHGNDLKLLRKLMSASDTIVLFGNSVSGHVSKCDSDRRTLPQMTADDLGRPVVDVSRGGLRLGEMMYLARIGAAFGLNDSVLVFPISPEAGFLRTTREPTGARAFLDKNYQSLIDAIGGERNNAAIGQPPDEFEGVHYGTYAEFSRTHFPHEKQAMGCPETQGNDRAFVRFMYWRNFLQSRSALVGMEAFQGHRESLSSRHIRVAFVLMPVNFDDLRELDGELAVVTVRQQIKEMRAALTRMGETVLDLSEKVGAAGFADRWCACGHMNEAGRAASAHYIAEMLQRFE